MPVVELKGQPVAYRVRTSKRAKRLSVRYSLRDGLELVCPLELRLPDPESVLQQRSDWILSAMDKFSAANANHARREYREGEPFPFRGVSYRLKLEYRPSIKRIEVLLVDQQLVVSLPDPVAGAARAEIRLAIQGFYRRQAQDFLPQRATALAEKHGFKFARVRIKNQKTRWGSCSAKRNINLNMRLMMAPDDAIDYVIIHELCHLRELNHSPAFWALVESCCPDYRDWKNWFKQHGPTLIL